VEDLKLSEEEQSNVGQLDLKMAGDLLDFIVHCLPCAVSIIKSDYQYNRLNLLKELLQHNGMTSIIDV